MRPYIPAVIGLLLLAAPMGWADSLLNRDAEKGGTLISERVSRFKPGDIVTVLIREEITASTQADTRTKKESDVESDAAAADNTFFMKDDDESGGVNWLSAGDLPNWNVETENESKFQGETVRSSSLETSISCFVTEVYENGNIMIEGDKLVTVNREDSMISVRGMARARDVTPANTVQSTQLANVQVQLKGKGPLWNNQRRGIFTKILDWFSPF